MFNWHTPCTSGPCSKILFGGLALKTIRLVTIFSVCLLLKASLLLAEEKPVTEEKKAVSETTTSNVKVTEAPVVTTANGVRVETRTVETQPLKEDKPTEHPRHFQGSSETKIENHITIDGRGLAYGAALPAVAPALATAVANEVVASRPLTITPVAGFTAYQGYGYNQVSNRGTVGVILDIPLISLLSIEAEGQYTRFSSNSSWGTNRGFSQYSGGGNAKITLGRGLLQPYLGAGMMAIYYEGLSNSNDTYSSQSNRVMGAGQLIAGADLSLFGGISIGARGEWLHPMTNLPASSTDQNNFDPMTSNFYRLLGTVKVSF